MYKTVKLRFIYIRHFKVLNTNRLEFNALNEDFFSIYDKCNLFYKYILKKQVYLFKYNSEFIGYLWLTPISSSNRKYFINSLYVKSNHKPNLSNLIYKILKPGSKIYYECKTNNENLVILNSCGFIKDECTDELIKSLETKELLNMPENIEFVKFINGQHENIRCDLQNQIFKNDSREPLTIEDIYADEIQDYYMKDWCIFVKCKNNYIGYGQVIKNDNIPTIVNFGILSGFRKNGYGELLLNYLCNIVYNEGYKDVRIKVNTNNKSAYDLYRKKGFIKVDEYSTWLLTK